jgi:DNA-binding response OmpR family regulator
MATSTILVADDSEVHCRVLSSVLGRESWNVVTAEDGQEAVDKAVAETPDLIILDSRMPRMSGPEACRMLRRREATRRVPILMLSAEGDVDGLRAGLESGCSDYLVTPLDFSELIAKVKRYVRRRS